MADSLRIETVYRHHIVMVRNRARRLLLDESAAEDVAQEAFIRILPKLKKAQDLESMGALLYTTVTRLALNVIRDKKRRRELLKERGGQLVPSALPSDSETIMTLHALFQNAPKEVALIAAYHFVDGMGHAEIAELTGIARRTISRRIEKFRKLSNALCEAA